MLHQNLQVPSLQLVPYAEQNADVEVKEQPEGG